MPSAPLPAESKRSSFWPGISLRRSRVYIASPDRHLLVDGHRLALELGPRENNSRPAIDPMHFALDENLRRALGSALRALEERVALTQKLERQSEDLGHHMTATTWGRKAREAQKELEVVRDAVYRIEDMAAKAELKEAG